MLTHGVEILIQLIEIGHARNSGSDIGIAQDPLQHGKHGAIAMEGLSVAARQLAFVIPGGLGVQEGSLVLLGHSFGISAELSLAVSLAKRLREVLCGLPALLSWQWLEIHRLRSSARKQTG